MQVVNAIHIIIHLIVILIIIVIITIDLKFDFLQSGLHRRTRSAPLAVDVDHCDPALVGSAVIFIKHFIISSRSHYHF